jgi:hypothetical protein
VEEEKEFVDREFQESKFIDDKFEHEGVEDEDYSQGFVNWDSPPIYDDDINEEDPIEEPLASNLEEKYGEYGLHPMFGSLYLDKDDQLEEEQPMDDIIDYEAIDDDFSSEVPNFNGEEGDYVDFLGIEDILNSLNNDVEEFYVDEENYMFIRETTADPFLSIFMAHGKEKEREKYSKSKELPSGVWGFHDKHRSMPMMKSVAFIMRMLFCFGLEEG